MAKIVFVNKDECTSCEECSDNLPDFFRMDDEDLAESHNGGANANAAEIGDDNVDEVQEQIDTCPGECIAWK